MSRSSRASRVLPVLLAVTAQTGERTLTWQAEQIAPTVPAVARLLLRLMRTDVGRQQRKALDRLATTTRDVERIQGAKVNARWMREFIAYDPLPTLRRVTVPVLALTGSKDVQVNPDDLRTIASTVASSASASAVPSMLLSGRLPGSVCGSCFGCSWV